MLTNANNLKYHPKSIMNFFFLTTPNSVKGKALILCRKIANQTAVTCQPESCWDFFSQQLQSQLK